MISKDWYHLFPAFPTVLVTVKNNIITIALCHVFSFKPPLIGIGIAPERYSYSLLKESKEFVVNIPTKDLLEQTLYCGTVSGRKIEKFKETKLTPAKSSLSAPLIKECPVNIECKTVKEIDTGDHTWFIGEVKNIHVADNYNKEDAIMYWAREFRLVGKVIGKR